MTSTRNIRGIWFMKNYDIRTFIVQDKGTILKEEVNVAIAILARDYKGWNNWRSLAVVTYED